jgi:hypothetical protein
MGGGGSSTDTSAKQINHDGVEGDHKQSSAEGHWEVTLLEVQFREAVPRPEWSKEAMCGPVACTLGPQETSVSLFTGGQLV